VRALGVDLGSKRIGIAVSDSAGTVATPLEVVRRGRSHPDDHRRILALADEFEAEALVVGLPLSLDGTVGPAARSVLEEVAELAGEVDQTARRAVAVVTYDERLTTVSADRSLMHQDLSSTERRAVVDQVAAAVLLQAWLDAGCPLDVDPTESGDG
jgi:putative pre-16S rRNA nuclease